MRASSELTIRNRRDLEVLNPYARDGSRPRFRRIRLELPNLPGREAAVAEAKLNDLYFACGCGEATVTGGLGFIGALGWITLRPGGWGSLEWSDGGVALGAFFLLAGVGKGVGLLRARSRLAALIDELRTRLPEAGVAAGVERARCAVT